MSYTTGRTYLTQKEKQRTLDIRAEAKDSTEGIFSILRIVGLDLISIYTWNWGFLISIKLFMYVKSEGKDIFHSTHKQQKHRTLGIRAEATAEKIISIYAAPS